MAAIGLVVNIISALLLSGGHHHGGRDHHPARTSSIICRRNSGAHAAPLLSHRELPKFHQPGVLHASAASDHDHRHADQHHDNNLRAAFVHVLADALMSVLAIAALLVGRFLGWVWLDAVMGIVGAIVIASWAWTLLRDTAAVLLDTTDPDLAARMSKPRAMPASPIFTSGALDRARMPQWSA